VSHFTTVSAGKSASSHPLRFSSDALRIVPQEISSMATHDAETIPVIIFFMNKKD